MKIYTEEGGLNYNMMMNTPAHWQHMNVVKHYDYILSCCGKQSILV